MVGDNHELNTQGWLAAQRICRAMLDEVAEIANTVTASIRTAQHVYSVIPEIAHRAAVEVQVRNKFRALSEQPRLSTSELEAATDPAADRAAGGIPIGALIAAYQAADPGNWAR